MAIVEVYLIEAPSEEGAVALATEGVPLFYTKLLFKLTDKSKFER